jgi:hypothetical protein
MVKRQNVCALVMINPIGFFYSDGKPMGVEYEALRGFESFLSNTLKVSTNATSPTRWRWNRRSSRIQNSRLTRRIWRRRLLDIHCKWPVVVSVGGLWI